MRVPDKSTQAQAICWSMVIWRPKKFFISAPTKPKHILSGLFVADKKLKHIDALEKKRTGELDWEIPRRLKREAELN